MSQAHGESSRETPGSARVPAGGQPPPPSDPRGSELELVRSFQRLQVQPETATRPGQGTLGQPGIVKTNLFAVNLPARTTYYEYKIAISPQEATTGKTARILELVERSSQFAPFVPHIAHDGSQRLVSARQLPQPLEVPVRYVAEGAAEDANALTFTAEFKFLRELQTHPLTQYMSGDAEHRNVNTQPLVSALNLVVQQYASRHGVCVKKGFFFPSSAEHYELSPGVEALRGFVLSVRPTYKQLMVNIDVCMAAFHTPGNLADAMLAFQRQSSGGMPSTFGRTLKVSTRHLGATFTIFGIMTGKTARTERLDAAEFGGLITMEEFFRRKYQITLRHAADLPLVNLSSRPEKPVYVPAEICEIVPWQAYRGNLDPIQTAAMVSATRVLPAFNADAVTTQGLTELGLAPNTPRSVLDGFGIRVNGEMTVVRDRCLPPPSIAYRAGRPPQLRDAAWNTKDVQLQTGASLTRWAVLLVQDGRRDEFTGPDDPELIAFLKTFLAKCAASGVQGAQSAPRIMAVRLPGQQRDGARVAEAIQQEFKARLDRNAKPSVVLVLLPGFDRVVYHAIKRLADVDMGLQTVHMLLNKARGDSRIKQDQYFANVILKLNAKLGGVNHVLDSTSMSWLRAKKTMVMGVDVTHPGPGSPLGTPSIAAVVANVDDSFSQFPASLKLQKADWKRESREMVEGLTGMTVERLQVYLKKNGQLPDSIIVYRAGVSQGQCQQILKEELPRLQAAFKLISPQAPYKPLLTIVVCGKRHHAKFYPVDSQHATRNGNTPPGTVMDQTVTDIYNFDFYLQAHNGPQGHVNPTHYTVLYDENHFSADTIQQGTHTASYMYARATRAVSLIPAAYYADIACKRGKSYLHAMLNAAMESGSATADTEAEKEMVYQRAVKTWGRGVHADLKESMFYI